MSWPTMSPIEWVLSTAFWVGIPCVVLYYIFVSLYQRDIKEAGLQLLGLICFFGLFALATVLYYD